LGMPERCDPVDMPAPVESARLELEAEEGRLIAMETAIEDLKRELAEVRAELQLFREQFE